MKKSGFHFCHILESTGDKRRFWRFQAKGARVSLAEHKDLAPAELPPAKLVQKDWRSLVQPKVNIAWLPAGQVFLRVIQLPAADFSELLSMVELQLEKLSPLPVNQVVWSVELLPKEGEMQPVIVVMAGRDVIEPFLGELESAGYLPDRLEVPHLHRLLATHAQMDGAWIFPGDNGDSNIVLIAWWQSGVLQQLQLVHLPEGEDQRKFLTDQLTQSVWAGELEGWLNLPVKWHLISPNETTAYWESWLSNWAGQPVAVIPALDKQALAEYSAQRLVRKESTANLLPSEHRARYRQQFIDRLWMNGLGAALGVYLAGVVIYFGVLHLVKYQNDNLQVELRQISRSYTNAMRLEERIEVVENQLNLKFAALDTWRAVSEHLPQGLILNQLTFSRGESLQLGGFAPSDQEHLLTDYNEALRKETVNGRPLFSDVTQPNWTRRPGSSGPQTIHWTFNCSINRQ